MWEVIVKYRREYATVHGSIVQWESVEGKGTFGPPVLIASFDHGIQFNTVPYVESDAGALDSYSAVLRTHTIAGIV